MLCWYNNVRNKRGRKSGERVAVDYKSDSQSMYVSAISAKPPSARSKEFVMKLWNDWTARQDLTTKHGTGANLPVRWSQYKPRAVKSFGYLNFGGLKNNFLPTRSFEKTRSGNAKYPVSPPDFTVSSTIHTWIQVTEVKTLSKRDTSNSSGSNHHREARYEYSEVQKVCSIPTPG
jgi:hypothetical protein